MSLPYKGETNDGPNFRTSHEGDYFAKVCKAQFDQLYKEGAESGRLMSLGLHPHVSGIPFRAKVIGEFIDYAKGFDGVWWASREDIAEWYLENHQSHIG